MSAASILTLWALLFSLSNLVICCVLLERKKLVSNLFDACDSTSIAQLHSQVIKSGLAHDWFFAAKLNSLYVRHMPLETARKVFDETPHRSVHLWNAMLRRYCSANQWEETLHLFHQMVFQQRPDNFTIPIAVKACAGLAHLKFGRVIHGLVKKNPTIDLDMFVGSALIKLYSISGCMQEALKVFEEFDNPDTAMWTSVITGYVKDCNPERALAFFSFLMEKNQQPDLDPVTLVSVVSACTKLLNIKLGTCVHGFIIKRGLDTNIPLVTSLLHLYSKTGSAKSAANLFESMPQKDVISWSTMIAFYAQNDAAGKALDLFNEMIHRGTEPNSVTLFGALQACAVACNIDEGKRIHKLAAEKGLEFDALVSTALIDMYMKCSSPEEANKFFKRIPMRDVVAWVTLLSGYALHGMLYESMGIFRSMLSSGVQPDAVAVVKILTCCSEAGILQQASCLHCYVIRCGFDCSLFVGAALIELYSKCGSLGDAVKIFEGMVEKDVVIWISMISAYGIHGQGMEALNVFDQMVSNFSTRPNSVTFLSLLSACSRSGLVKEGIIVFNTMVQIYQVKPSFEHYRIIVDLLSRTGELDKAVDIIDQMLVPAGPHVWGALLVSCRNLQDTEITEIAAKNLFQLDPKHAVDYLIFSNIYAGAGVPKDNTLMGRKSARKMNGLSTVEVSNKIHSFFTDDRSHPYSQQIYGLLRTLEFEVTNGGSTS